MAKKKKKNSNLRAIPKEIKMTIPSVEIVYFLQNLIDPKDTLQYYIVSDYEEVFSNQFEDEVFADLTQSATAHILYDYLKDPIFESKKPKESSK